jgi:hypothetical protein
MIRRNLFLGPAVFVLFLLCFGCAVLKEYKSGRFVANDEVNKMFETGYVNPDYKYYYSGSDSSPIAIMGLERKLPFDDNELWKPIDEPSKGLKDKIKGMRDRTLGIMHFPWGFAILDNGGKRIGAWYSIPSAITTILIKNDSTIIVYTPNIQTYLKLEEGPE